MTLVCEFCLSVFMSNRLDVEENDECPECNVGTLIDYEEYKLRLSSSFMQELSEERGVIDDDNDDQ